MRGSVPAPRPTKREDRDFIPSRRSGRGGISSFVASRLMLQVKLNESEKVDLVAFMRQL